MAWGAQQWVRITKEATYGTFDASALTADINWYRLTGNNPFTMRVTPQRQTIRSADGGNRRRQVVATRKVVAGNLSTQFYPSQAAKLLAAGMTLTSNDLSSYTIDYWDTVQEQRFLGCKVQSLAATGTATGDHIPMTIGWLGQSKGTPVTLTQPADTVFPTDLPYLHFESKGLLSIGGTITKYSSLGFDLKNHLDGTWDEDQYITSCLYCGRDLDLTVKLQYISSTLRAALEAQTALTITSAWARSGGVTSTLDLKTKSYVATVSDDLALDKAGYQTIKIEAFYDAAAGTDFAFTVA
jgi:hypothetical protein